MCTILYKFKVFAPVGSNYFMRYPVMTKGCAELWLHRKHALDLAVFLNKLSLLIYW